MCAGKLVHDTRVSRPHVGDEVALGSEGHDAFTGGWRRLPFGGADLTNEGLPLG